MANGRLISVRTTLKGFFKVKTQPHPLHATAVPDLQLFLGSLEATVLLVVGRGLEVDVNIVGGLGSQQGDCQYLNTYGE